MTRVLLFCGFATLTVGPIALGVFLGARAIAHLFGGM